MHLILDVMGLIPGWGDLADLANAAVYLQEGNVKEAGEIVFSVITNTDNIKTLNKFRKQLNLAYETAENLDELGDGYKAAKKITKEAKEGAAEKAGKKVVKEGATSTVQKVFTDNPFDEAGNLKPNIKYQAGEFKYNYETDASGRISNWNTDNLQLTERDGRLDYNSDTPGKIEGDHAGHLAGDRFGGSPELDNIVSQSQNVNLSQYKKIENRWAKKI